MVELSELQGLWRRTLVVWPGDRFDTTTEVYWLQGPSHYADLRVPAGRPQFERAACLRDLDWPMLRFMALQEGFFGHLEVANSIAHWNRAFDYQPAIGAADRGRLEFEAGMLVEHGVEAPYIEHWRREPETAQDVVALWLSTGVGAQPIGCLIATADVFIYARGRAGPLPRDTTLSRLVDGATSLAEAQALFDCEISFGRRGAEGWSIERSSLPFREGQMLAPESTAERLAVHDLTPEGNAFIRIWRIAVWESTAGAFPFDWFRSAPGRDAQPHRSSPQATHKNWRICHEPKGLHRAAGHRHFRPADGASGRRSGCCRTVGQGRT